MTNRLAQESSPYLLQHAENPVDWYPWGPEALQKAKAEQKPIFLSVGYSACHWCHVMAHESFEDPKIAQFLNRYFVAIKVDREERPDIDAVYMDALQSMKGQGGWPMSMFLTPEGVPFYGGTYFSNDRRSEVTFGDVLRQMSMAWRTRKSEILEMSAKLAGALRTGLGSSGARGEAGLAPSVLDSAAQRLLDDFDSSNGGFGSAPKFPQPMVLEFLLRRHVATGDPRVLAVVTRTLDAMAGGGIFDQLGGGFHRYSTDEAWLVPHFEKMLYDNAQLARVYLHAWQVTGESLYKRVTVETLDYVIRELSGPDGGFFSSQDADSEGSEGRYYVWTPDEVKSVLEDSPRAFTADDTGMFLEAYGVTARGNFEGANILSLRKPISKLTSARKVAEDSVEARLAEMRAAMLESRETRVKPDRDEKVLASWNGLMLAALSEAAGALGRDDYRAAAEKNAAFLLERMMAAEGRVLHSWNRGRTGAFGYLQDQADAANGLLQLYQTTFDPRWFVAARGLCDFILDHYADPDGGFFDTSDDHEELMVRPKGLQEGAEPSGGSMAATVLLAMAALAGDVKYERAARSAMIQVVEMMAEVPLGFSQWLIALDFHLAPPKQVAVVGDDVAALLETVRSAYRPDTVVASGPGTGDSPVPLLEGRTTVDGRPTAYVCTGTTCGKPVTEPEELAAQLERASRR